MDMFMTGDLAFLLSIFGLNPAASTYGNPWVTDINTDGTVIWREDVDMYLLSHETPPGHCFDKDGPIACPACNFKAVCQEDVEKDKEKEYPKNFARSHFGNYIHQRPVLNIGPSHTLPPVYHLSENLIAYRFKHLIWEGRTKEEQWDINKILQEHLGETSYVPLPPKRGDDIYCCSWIGQDACNLRATDTLIHVLKYLYPDDWEESVHTMIDKESAKEKEPAPISDENLDQFDNLYSDSSSEEEDVEQSLQNNIEMGENLHALDLNKSQLIGDAFDTAYDYIDALVDWDWEETEVGKKKKASEMMSLGKAANKALTRALVTPCFSEYNTIIEHVVPKKITEYGKLLLQANEQGQESAGQMLKKLLRHSANKRRKMKDYMRKGKNGKLTLCKFKKAATIGSTETLILALRLDALHTVN